MKKKLWLLMLFAPPVLMGANGEGCAAEIKSNDPEAKAWPRATVPEPAGEVLPMSCAWLDGDNCWKRAVRSAKSCAPEGQGIFDEERKVCTYKDGARLEFANDVGRPSEDSTLVPFIEHRILTPDGDSCFVSRILDWFHGAIEVDGEVTQSINDSTTKIRVICPDGTTYSNAVEGTCADFGVRWLAKGVPGYTLTCSGTTQVCTAEFSGADQGKETLTSCGGTLGVESALKETTR